MRYNALSSNVWLIQSHPICKKKYHFFLANTSRPAHSRASANSIWGSFELISVRLERTKEPQFKPQHQADIAI
jgi:hypothetical protein